MLRSVVALIVLTAPAAADHDTRVGGGHVPERPPRALDLAVSAGAGMEGFLGGTARDRFSPGPSWNVRVGMLNRSEIRFEIIYAGSSQEMTDTGARLVAHGIYGQLRVNVAPRWTLEPFFYAGGGWTRFGVTTTELGDLKSPDDVLEIPFGVGIARRFGDFVLDARAGMTIASGADLVPPGEMSSATEGHSLHRFGVRANIGIDL